MNNKLYLGIAVAAAVVLIAVVVLIICLTSCGGSAKTGGEAAADNTLFEFETTMTEEDQDYPVACISATDFHALMEDENTFSVANLFAEELEPYGATLHLINEVIISGTDYMSVKSKSGMYLEKGKDVIDIDYSNCARYVFDIDGDSEDELIFYTCEINPERTRFVCTYYVIEAGESEVYWCRYNSAWAVGSSKAEMSMTDIDITAVEGAMAEGEVFLVSLMIPGVDKEVYGQLVCDITGEEPFLYIEAGEYNDLLKRVDGLDR